MEYLVELGKAGKEMTLDFDNLNDARKFAREWRKMGAEVHVRTFRRDSLGANNR